MYDAAMVGMLGFFFGGCYDVCGGGMVVVWVGFGDGCFGRGFQWWQGLALMVGFTAVVANFSLSLSSLSPSL